MEVITTCSPKNFDFVRSLGAKHVFDYNDENVAQKIKEAVPGLKYVFDTIGNSSSSSIASQSLDRCGGQLCTVRPGKGNTENVPKWTRVTDVLVWTAFLKEHQYGHFRWPMPQLLRDGKIKPNNVKLFDGGLGSVTEGFQQYRDGKISGYKIVYSMW
ncbi:unnamed protein product [Parascedosporium putredinis]|uniref:Alcohol dehydrogenase-like C-terminal domain-containing protein n=1 Tax=Parascedosporium putredinis TaxID=1442378 RepID=A0A9P1HCZ5_9PEZI|nr:unnamed protein product [Parascedosporium putredinis]CAI8005186.1 unnamed protein product [Parascedosporium putredinis]